MSAIDQLAGFKKPDAEYQIMVLKKQIAELERALNEVRAKLDMAQIQTSKPAR